MRIGGGGVKVALWPRLCDGFVVLSITGIWTPLVAPLLTIYCGFSTNTGSNFARKYDHGLCMFVGAITLAETNKYRP